jgi:hypothetical protein
MSSALTLSRRYIECLCVDIGAHREIVPPLFREQEDLPLRSVKVSNFAAIGGFLSITKEFHGGEDSAEAMARVCCQFDYMPLVLDGMCVHCAMITADTCSESSSESWNQI